MVTDGEHSTVKETILVVVAPPFATIVYVDVHVPGVVVGTEILLQFEVSAAVAHPVYVILP